MKRALLGGIVLVLVALFACALFVYISGQRAEAYRATIDGIPVMLEVARTSAEHERGLMYREELAQDAGMVFLFTVRQVRMFWNQNTFVPLDILWLDSGRIIGIASLPSVRTSGVVRVVSPAPVDAVIELPAGWAASHAITVGDRADVDSLR